MRIGGFFTRPASGFWTWLFEFLRLGNFMFDIADFARGSEFLLSGFCSIHSNFPILRFCFGLPRITVA